MIRLDIWKRILTSQQFSQLRVNKKFCNFKQFIKIVPTFRKLLNEGSLDDDL